MGLMSLCTIAWRCMLPTALAAPVAILSRFCEVPLAIRHIRQYEAQRLAGLVVEQQHPTALVSC